MRSSSAPWIFFIIIFFSTQRFRWVRIARHFVTLLIGKRSFEIWEIFSLAQIGTNVYLGVKSVASLLFFLMKLFQDRLKS